MKAILHIGTEKTGTTSIQSCLTANRNCLSDMGYAYPFSPGRMNHRKLAVYAMSHDRTDDFCKRNSLLGHKQRISWEEAFRKEFILEISQLDHSVHTVILSSEHLQSRLNSSKDVARLHNLLAPLFTDIKVLVYLRRQDKAATSRYSTALKAGYSVKSILPQNGGNRRFYDYEHLLDIWSTVFGRKHVVPRIFDRREFVDNDLITDFLIACGIESPGRFGRPQHENESLKPVAQELLRLYNKIMPRYLGSRLNPLRKKDFVVDYLVKNYSGMSRQPLRKEAEDFYANYKSSNDRVAREWFGKECLFDEDFSNYPDASPERFSL